MNLLFEIIGGAIVSLLLILFGVLSKRISQNEKTIREIEQVIVSLSKDVQHLRGFEGGRPQGWIQH